jgi:hypothetical protein
MEADFSSPKVLVDRARFHVMQFSEIIDETYIRGSPFERFTEYDPDAKLTLHKLRITQPIPILLPVLVFDCVNALRSALDHAVYDATVILTGDASPKYTKFPSGKTAEDAKKDIARKNGQVPPELGDFLLTFEPYEGGNPVFRDLTEIRNGKIHRTLQLTAVAAQGAGIIDGAGDFHMHDMPNNWDAGKQELTYMRTSKMDESFKLQISVAITLGGGAPNPGKPALEVLGAFGTEVERIVLAIEAETARILASRS